MPNHYGEAGRDTPAPLCWNLTDLRQTFDYVVSEAGFTRDRDRSLGAVTQYDQVSHGVRVVSWTDWMVSVRTAIAYAELRLSEDVASNKWNAMVRKLRDLLTREEAAYKESMEKSAFHNPLPSIHESSTTNVLKSASFDNYRSCIERLALRRRKTDIPNIVGPDGNLLSLVEIVRGLPGGSQYTDARDQFHQSCEAALTARADLLNEVRSVHAEWAKGKHWLEGVASRDGFTHTYTDELGAAIDDHLAIAHRWYILKAKLLGVPYLSYAQSQHPLEYSIPFAWSRVLSATREALHSLSPDLSADLDLLIDKERIDTFPRPRGRQDAFCRFVAPGIPPYVHVTWREDWTSLEEWVHELGHAIHAVRIDCSDPLTYEPSETIAELVASAFAIQLVPLVIERLAADTDAAPLECFLLDRLVSSIFSLRALWKFEEQLQQSRKGYTWQHADMTALWQDVVTRMMGPSLRLEEGERWKWAVIPHFVDAPGYLWKYVMPDVESLRMIALGSAEGQTLWFPLGAFRLGASADLAEVERLFTFGGPDNSSWDAPFAVLTHWLDQAEERFAMRTND